MDRQRIFFEIRFHKKEINIGFQLFYEFLVFFCEIGKDCFEDKQGVLELKTWCQFMCTIIIIKYMPKMQRCKDAIHGQEFYFFNLKKN